MAYRRSITGLTKLDPRELAEKWDRTPCANEVTNERRHELRMTRRATERGFGLAESVKDRMVEVVHEVMDDGLASNRDRLTAVDAGIKMVALDVRIDQTAAENSDQAVTLKDVSLRAKQLMDAKLEEIHASRPVTPPSVAQSPEPPSRDSVPPAPVEKVDTISGFQVVTLRAFPDTARDLEKSGRIPEGTCARVLASRDAISDAPQPPPGDTLVRVRVVLAGRVDEVGRPLTVEQPLFRSAYDRIRAEVPNEEIASIELISESIVMDRYREHIEREGQQEGD
jgi:hypothetical protein